MVRAKFKITSKTESIDGFNVLMSPVTSGSKENEEFFKFTPGGQITIGTVNPVAAAQLEVGKEYYVDFTKAE
jgi:hypothetical protein